MRTIYDGTESTLPAPDLPVLIESKAGRGPYKKTGYLSTAPAVPWWWVDGLGFQPLVVGDSWIPLDEI